MFLRTHRRLPACVLLFSLASLAAQTIQVDVNVVNVLCTVRDSRGALITSLQRDDFEILENGGVQKIRYFARDTDLPLTVALLIDVSGSVRKFVRAEKGAAVQFLREVLRPTDQALITGFPAPSSSGRTLLPRCPCWRVPLKVCMLSRFADFPKTGFLCRPRCFTTPWDPPLSAN